MKRLALVAALLTLSLTACGEKPKAPVVEAPAMVAPAADAAASAAAPAAPAAAAPAAPAAPAAAAGKK